VSSLESELSNFNIYLEKIYSSDSDVLLAVKKLNVSIKYLENLSDVNLLEKNDILVTTLFEELAVKRPCFRILGRPALLELAESSNGLQGINRHRYCNALVGAIVSVTGIQKRDEMARLLSLIRWMGGSFRENINYKTTHLVSGYACSAKSQYAYLHEIPVVGTSWLHAAWERHDEMDFKAINLSFFSEHKLKPFHGAKICFSGFMEEERSHMVDVLLQNGGTPIDDENDTECVSSLESELSNFNIYLEKIYSSDSDVLLAVKKLNVSIKYLENLSDVNLLDKNDILVTTLFEELAVKRPCFRILGRPALLELAESPNGLQGINRHRYCNALVGAIVSVTGIQKRDEMARLLSLIRWMGGSFRENINHKTTHLVSGYACSAKSQYAYLHEIPVVGASWLHAAWERRDEMDFKAINSSFFSEHKLKPFHGAKICFSGFTEEERSHMVDVLLQNGGTPIGDENDTECTHLVTKEGSSPLGDRDPNTTPCLRGVLAPKNLIQAFDKEDSSPNTRNGGLKRTLSVVDCGNISHETKKIRLQFLDTDCDEFLFKHPNPMSARLDQTDQTLVVNESSLDSIPPVKKNNAEILKEAWFWTSVQYQSCALTKEYLLTNLNVTSTPTSARVMSSTLTLSSSSRARKRKRHLDRLGSLLRSSPTPVATIGETSPTNSSGPSKRRSSAANTLDGLRLSCGSFLNFTNSPDHPSPFKLPKDPDLVIKDKPFSPRYQVFSELLQTEINYVGVLNTIITVYKEPLEEMIDKEDCLLNNTEIKIIFG
ncbi:protein ECT2 isoform X1, partial [Aphis craccivora]